MLALVGLYLAYERFGVAGLAVTSEPEGALVRVNGRAVGVTPLRGVRLSPGMYLIELQHSHFQPFERRLSLAAGPTTDLHAVLERGQGTVVIHSNPRGAWIEIDGQRRDGVTPRAIDLPSGEHQIVVGMAERRSAAEAVVLHADERVEVRIDLDMDPHGSLVVETGPGAEVTLPGSAIAYQPGVRLPIGEYLVRVTARGYVTQERRLLVRYGDNRYRVDLARAYGTLHVSGLPPDARVQVAYRENPDAPLVRHAYRPGMRLPVGEVEVRARAMGRRSAYRRVTVDESGTAVALSLQTMSTAYGGRLRDALSGGGHGPELVVIPPGEFVMGTEGGVPSETPPRRVALTEPFAFAIYEVRADEYRRFAAATGRPLDARVAETEPNLPVTRVTFSDGAAYADWLTEQTGHRYRLPSEAEWEYVARAGSTTEFPFGDDPENLCRFANVADRSIRRRPVSAPVVDCDDGYPELAPVGSFTANAFGVYDMLGNVAEWVADCGMPPYRDAADDGTPADEGANCPTRGVRGGSWDSGADELRVAKRGVASSASPTRGIRLLREL